MAGQQRRHVHLTHWGAAEIESDGRQLTSVRPWREDPDPSRILENLAAAHRHPARIGQPYIRQGWLEHGPGAAPRGSDVFVPVSWETALDLLATELRRAYGRYGPDGVFGESYGWASAGRFHHAQSQLHRFLNCLGGYVRSVNTYSYGASSVLLPHVVGDMSLIKAAATAWPVIAEHTGLIVAFGGLSPKNSAMASGGIGRHTMGQALASAVARGCRLVSVSLLRTDTDISLGAEWIAPVPGTDVALMLALCHVLDSGGLADRRFLDRYTVGYPRFAAYVRGDADGVPKTPEWAAALTGIPAERIRALSLQMAAARTLVTVSWSLQRAEHGEQPVWLGLVLAAMLGQIGLPGGGFGHGYGSSGDVGNARRMSAPHLPQGVNGIDSYIPVARIADMLLHPGAGYDYDGQRRRYPPSDPSAIARTGGAAIGPPSGPRWHPDGNIELRDRGKDIIIISGGENISSIEVEQAIAAHPAVLECAVIGIPHPHWGERPKAFVTLNEGAAAAPEEIIAFCRERLAHYKCPDSIEFGPLPKTSTGKTQKFVLRQRE